MQKNKKGAEKIISVYWFAILFIVAGAMVYMVSSFYGKPYDVREIEAGLLTNKIAECLSVEGYINENWGNLNTDNFLDQCGLDFNTEEIYSWNDDQYYIEVNISEKIISVGNTNLKGSCFLQGKNAPPCLESSLYAIDLQDNNYKINILSIVRKTEKNV
ncbi:MAG: hypothetical protein Q8P15_03940 [Nanoarchaeota archaeon]|nr:hypothetical protein [Nanoarchaeota archaeon]